MFGLGPWELIIILVVLVFFFGGKRLGDIGEGLGKSISEFKKAVRHDAPKTAKPVREARAAAKPSEARERGGPTGLIEERSSPEEEEKSP